MGWIQITNFVKGAVSEDHLRAGRARIFVAGLLSTALAVGMCLVVHPGRAGTWEPILTGVFGAGSSPATFSSLTQALGFVSQMTGADKAALVGKGS